MSLNNAHEGYQYQDLLCAYFILKEAILGHFDAILTFDKKHIKDDRFDDLVIKNNNSIERKQIKYSNDINDKALAKDDLSNDTGTSLAIYKLFENWQKLRTNNTEFRLCLAWHSPVEENIINSLILQENCSSFNLFKTQVFKLDLDKIWQKNPEKFNRWDNLKKYVKDNSVDRNEFLQFCNELLIETNLPKASLDFFNPDSLEKILIDQANKIGVGEYPNNNISIYDFLIKLVKFSGDFRTKSKQLSIAQILDKMGIKTDFGYIEQKFKIDKNKNILFKEKTKKLLQIFRKNQKSILIAEPGAGKSWFLTNFIELLKEHNLPVIRHYCFTEMNDDFYEQRVKADVFFGNLIADIKLLYPELIIEKDQIFASNINELNLLLSKIKEPLIIVIDGLDHIDRIKKLSKTLSEDKTRIIEFISKINIPNHMSIILGSQPVNEIKILIDHYNFLQVDLPKWNLDDVFSLASKFKINISLEEQGELLLHKSQGNPLYLTYILKHLQDEPNTDIKNNFPEYDFNLEKYYDFLSSKFSGNLTTLDILSCLEFSITRAEFKELNPFSHHLDKDLEILSPVISENLSRGGISLYHDSFRRYQLAKLSKSSINCYILIINWLEKKGFYENKKSYRYLFKYLFRAEGYEKILEYATPDFLIDSLYYGYPEKLIQDNSFYFFYVAQKLENWGLLAFFSEFNRTIYSTNSDEYQNQFIENFEIYFEIILMLYGQDRANSLLFFNDEMNFDLITTAKAFSILSKNGYNPNWDRVSSLFKNSVSIDNFEYYLYTFIHDQDKLINILIKSIEKGYEDFFDIGISFLFKNNYEKVINLFIKRLGDDINDDIILKINKLSLLHNNEFYIPVHIKLRELSIEFMQNGSYFDTDTMVGFYVLVALYAKNNIEYLIEFEKTIEPKSFSYNWIKFLIRTFIMEASLSLDNIEEETIKNIEFLCSDIDSFKGNPRAIDLKTSCNERLIELSMLRALKHISTKENWRYVLELLINSPVSIVDIVVKNLLNNDNIDFVLNAYNVFEKDEDLDYSQCAEYCFKKAFVYAKKQDKAQARYELKKSIKYITSYTFRKDITLSELIAPINSIANLDSNLSLNYLKKLKYLTDAVAKHTEDGKDIKWIAIDWFKHLLNINYELSVKYLIYQFVKDPYFWKLDYMLVDLLAVSQERIDPVILNFIYKLLPTNNRGGYLSGFLYIINKIKNENTRLAKLSLISLVNRNWNDGYEKLSKGIAKKFGEVCQEFDLKLNIDDKQDENKYKDLLKKELLVYFINKSLNINYFFDFKKINVNEVINFYNEKSIIDRDFNFLYFYLMESKDEEIIEGIISFLIKKKFPCDHKIYFINTFDLIKKLDLSKELKIKLLTLNTFYSIDGWMNMCVYPEPLKLAVGIDIELAKNAIFNHMCEYLKQDKYRVLPISNLISAFEFSGINKEIILDLYENAYRYIENRLPDSNDFQWGDIESNYHLSNMNENELAVTLIFTKMKHFDSSIQRKVLFSLHYFINTEVSLLIKPVKWFLDNLTEFNLLNIFSIFELFYLEKENAAFLIRQCKNDFSKAYQLNNKSINNLIDELIEV